MPRRVMSETVVLKAIRNTLGQALRAPSLTEARRAVREAKDMATMLEKQAAQGLHANPALAVVNPPLRTRRVAHGTIIGQVARSVEYMEYIHAENGKGYHHTFEPNVQMFARRDGNLLLTRSDDKPLWEEFE